MILSRHAIAIVSSSFLLCVPNDTLFLFLRIYVCMHVYTYVLII